VPTAANFLLVHGPKGSQIVPRLHGGARPTISYSQIAKLDLLPRFGFHLQAKPSVIDCSRSLQHFLLYAVLV
jgi:hypothetical protein